MQGEVHGLALPAACAAAIDTPVTARVQQQCLSVVDQQQQQRAVAGLSSLSSLSLSGEVLAKAEQSERALARSSTALPMAVMASDMAVADIAPPVPNRHDDDFVLDIARQMERFVFAFSENRAPSDAGSSNRASPMFVVVGHRGCGMNKYSPFGRTDMPSIRENTISSFNMAARNGVQFVEFDVQVTKDGVPIIFHDDVILTDDTLPGKHIGDLTLEEFRAIGPQRDPTKVGQPLYRTERDEMGHSTVKLWTTDVEDSMCTLAEAFSEVQPSVGFNIELKFADDGSTSQEELHRVIDAVLEDVRRWANGRMIYFSSFHPDAVQIVRQKLSAYPVFFLTDQRSDHKDDRRNSIEAAIEVCRSGNLQGIVSEVGGVLANPGAVALAKAQGLYLFTYGGRNNLGEVVLEQRRLGIDGVIVDHVLEMVRVARHMHEPDAVVGAAMSRRTVSVDHDQHEEKSSFADTKTTAQGGGRGGWIQSTWKIVNLLVTFLSNL